MLGVRACSAWYVDWHTIEFVNYLGITSGKSLEESDRKVGPIGGMDFIGHLIPGECSGARRRESQSTPMCQLVFESRIFLRHWLDDQVACRGRKRIYAACHVRP